ncbi:MAG: DoxX family protein [Nocardioidaceae bacterium]|nr:DoxX family protein [Nocardioidaceae bacterium]
MEQTATRPAPDTRYRAGVVVTALIALFLAFDSIIHILEIDAAVESFAELGYPEGSAVAIGVLELACLALYVIPRTAVLGAVLLTGYLGGAVSAHVRIESPLFSTTLFPVYVGVAVWVGLYLRDPRLRTLLAG